jgi:hypothetical protein
MTERGCKILINPTKDKYEGLPHAINPDLSSVYGIPPELWVIHSGSITPKNVAPKKKKLPSWVLKVAIVATISMGIISYILMK